MRNTSNIGVVLLQAVTVDAEEHQRILLEQLNAIYAPAGGEGEALDYGYEEGEPGPLQLTLPLGPALPRPQPLHADGQVRSPPILIMAIISTYMIIYLGTYLHSNPTSSSVINSSPTL